MQFEKVGSHNPACSLIKPNIVITLLLLVLISLIATKKVLGVAAKTAILLYDLFLIYQCPHVLLAV